MRIRAKWQAVATCFAVAAACGLSPAETIFFDNFDDRSVTNDSPLTRDGLPVRWRSWNGGVISADGGDLVVEATTEPTHAAEAAMTLRGDLSVRVPGRLETDGSLVVRAMNYWGLLNADGQAAVGRFGSSPGVDTAATALSPRVEDVVLQLDTIGDAIKFWAWHVGEPMPRQPTAEFVDPNGSACCVVAVGGVSGSFPDVEEQVSIFRSVLVADSHIPEPSAAVIAGLLTAGIACGGARLRDG